MITEDYVSFETAKLLKDKGFNIPCRSNYRSKYKDCKVPFYHNTPKNFNGKEYEGLNSEWFSAPTLQMAMKWLREKHNWTICISPYWAEGDMRNKLTWYYYIYSLIDNRSFRESSYTDNYTEACENAIKYCLENLI